MLKSLYWLPVRPKTGNCGIHKNSLLLLNLNTSVNSFAWAYELSQLWVKDIFAHIHACIKKLKMPEFYLIFARKILSPDFFGGRAEGKCPPLLPTPTPKHSGSSLRSSAQPLLQVPRTRTRYSGSVLGGSVV